MENNLAKESYYGIRKIFRVYWNKKKGKDSEYGLESVH